GAGATIAYWILTVKWGGMMGVPEDLSSVLTRSGRRLTRRSLLRYSLVSAAVTSIVAACGQAQAPAPTQAPAQPTVAPAAKPTTAPAAAATTAPAAAKPTAAPTTAAAAAPTPGANVKINGNFTVIQQRGFNPLQTTYIHDL